MSMPRPQFRLSTLLWLTAVVAGWFGGAEWGWRRNEPAIYRQVTIGDATDFLAVDVMVQPDGSKWYRPISEGESRQMPISFLDSQGVRISVERSKRSSRKATRATLPDDAEYQSSPPKD